MAVNGLRGSYLEDANQATQFAKKTGGGSSRTKPLKKGNLDE